MSEKSASAEYKRFVESIDSPDPEYREHLDEEALLATEGDDRKAAEDLLIDRVKAEDDWRVPKAIVAIRLKRAVPPMQARLKETKGRMRLALARALVELGALERIDEIVIDMLKGGDRDEGISALAAATELSSIELARALSYAMIHHPSPEVRINSGAKLLYISKVTKDPLVWKYRPLYMHLGDEDEMARRDAFEQIAKLAGVPKEFAD